MASSSNLGGVEDEAEEEWLVFSLFLLSSFFILHPSSFILRAWAGKNFGLPVSAIFFTPNVTCHSTFY
jgi:hypothetical protein